jgi:2-keto-4-pentenoate hydratase/2-oxohepta-3-ene-1,7-dioic acid hydratase in catechol pathway
MWALGDSLRLAATAYSTPLSDGQPAAPNEVNSRMVVVSSEVKRMSRAYRTSSIHMSAVAIAAVVTAGAFSADGSAARQAAQQPGATTFRLLTFEVGSSGPRLGATMGNGLQDIVDVHNAILYLLTSGTPEGRNLPAIPIDMRSLIEAGPASIAAAKSVHRTITTMRASGKFTEPGGIHRVFHPHAGVTFLPPIPNPSKILGLAGNYIRQSPDGKPGAFDAAEYPSAFLKPLSSLTGHDTEINLEGLLTTGVYEPEMTIVIGKKATNVSVADAMDYVMGYTIVNDVSSRDLKQGEHTSQGSTMGKGLDTFTPAGPYITLKEDVPNPHDLAILGVVNGKPTVWPVPNGNTSFLTFTVPETIAYFSERMTLLPGDLIATGVPAPSMTFAAGDTVELTIGHLGTLRNRVVSNPVPGHRIFPPRTAASRR